MEDNSFNPNTPLLVPDYYINKNCGPNILPSNIINIDDRLLRKEKTRQYYQYRRQKFDSCKFRKGNSHYVNGAITTLDALDEDVFVVDTKKYGTSIDIELSLTTNKKTRVSVRHINMNKYPTITKYMHICRRLLQCK